MMAPKLKGERFSDSIDPKHGRDMLFRRFIEGGDQQPVCITAIYLRQTKG